jgi:tRNA-5-taurinomethyluridine 2-sulfurtransferase
MNKYKKIAVLVSGGVDSSLALALLKKEGHNVTAFYLKIWLEDELSYLGSCPWQEDLEYVQAVCAQLNVPLQIISMQQVYHDQVVAHMLSEIKQGRTPNPDVMCNAHVKFGAFYAAIDPSFDYVATGHYAQIEHGPELSILKKGKDPVKDQTYFLASLTQMQLRRALFPVGALQKSQVRQLAQEFNLPTASRKDSQGICFLGKFDFKDFVKAHLGSQPGDLIEFETGAKLGVHEGYWFYTIGQRQGLGLSGGPWYVVSKDVAKNIVFISKTYDSVDQFKHGMIVRDFGWNGFKSLDVRFRHGPAVHPCNVAFSVPHPHEGGDPSIFVHTLQIMLKNDSKQGIAAGQFAVLYDGDICLGGGVIEKAL